jgi:hypothetical protein
MIPRADAIPHEDRMRMPNMKRHMQINEMGRVIFIPGINGPNFCLRIVMAHRNDFVGIED